MPVFDMIETVLVKKLRFKPTWYLRFISRNIYVGTLRATTSSLAKLPLTICLIL